MIKYASGGEHWDFWFCSFSYFLDRFFSFVPKNFRFFDFGVLCSLFPFFSINFGFWFSQKILMGFQI